MRTVALAMLAILLGCGEPTGPGSYSPVTVLARNDGPAWEAAVQLTGGGAVQLAVGDSATIRVTSPCNPAPAYWSQVCATVVHNVPGVGPVTSQVTGNATPGSTVRLVVSDALVAFQAP